MSHAVLPVYSECFERLMHGLHERFGASLQNMPIIGIHSGGVWLAEAVRQALQRTDAIGQLDIGFYRDDYLSGGLKAKSRASRLPFDVEDRELLLLDDVAHTGRTIRAALNEIFDYGRPKAVRLAVLIERVGRQLPISPDVAGLRLELPEQARVKLFGPSELRIEVCS
jgi:pyrimidine operon attenuation protein/uracil phosphoribosyltransferase